MDWMVRLAVFLGLFTVSVASEQRADIVVYPDGDSQLAHKYADFNRLWFDGKLPAKTVEIAWGELTGTYFTNYEGEGFHARISIIRKVQGYDNRVCMEVLHEMTHLKLAIHDSNLFSKESGSPHDAQFQQEMRGLAQRGAFTECW